MTAVGADFLDELGRLALFVDLPEDELEQIATQLRRRSRSREGEWILRQGDAHSALYVIVDGEVAVVIDDEDRRVLSKGAFFGEVSVLLEEPATASIVTRTAAQLPGRAGTGGYRTFLVSHPQVTYRILKAEARRLKTASERRT